MLVASVARAETPRSPYRITWLFPDNADSAIDVDRGDLSTSRFESDYELVQFLGKQPKPKKGKGKNGQDLEAKREAYYARISKMDLAPLWKVLKDIIPVQPDAAHSSRVE